MTRICWMQVLVYRPEGRLVAVECLAHPFFEVLRLAGRGGCCPARSWRWAGERRRGGRQEGTGKECEQSERGGQ